MNLKFEDWKRAKSRKDSGMAVCVEIIPDKHNTKTDLHALKPAPYKSTPSPTPLEKFQIVSGEVESAGGRY